MRFWLGFHQVAWMPRTGVPLFVSARSLRKRVALPEPAGPWALDSGGFTELTLHGRWTTPAAQYADEVARWADGMPGLAWASTQDWMCEPHMLARTGLTVGEHQRRSVASYLELTALAPAVPWVPVVQGWEIDDYHACVDLYERAGVRLADRPVVGLGSVCRRQGLGVAGEVVRSLYARGLTNLHGFGFKTLGLVSRKAGLAAYLASADSMAWSFRARSAWRHDKTRLCGGEHRGSCSNCFAWAIRWRERLVARIDRATRGGTQGLLC